MDFEQARQSVIDWLETFVEVPHAALAGFPPCPYAKRARIKNRIDYRAGNNPYTDLVDLANTGMETYDVVVYMYDPTKWSASAFEELIHIANVGPLKSKKLISLSDHPGSVETVNGVVFNHGTLALSIATPVKSLDDASQQLHAQGYYNNWPKDYLDDLFTNRQDPRQV